MVADKVLLARIRPPEPSNMSCLFAVEMNHAPLSTFLKDEASLNILLMCFTSSLRLFTVCLQCFTDVYSCSIVVDCLLAILYSCLLLCLQWLTVVYNLFPDCLHNAYKKQRAMKSPAILF